MSRIGRAPITIPDGVTVSVDGDVVKVKGPKGELAQALEGGITAVVEEGVLRINRGDDEQKTRARHGL